MLGEFSMNYNVLYTLNKNKDILEIIAIWD